MTRQIAAAAAARAARAGAESRSRTSGSSARAAGGNGALGLPLVRALPGLGPAAAPYADRLRAPTSDREHWVRVEAAYALWVATGDGTTAVPVLAEVVRPLAEGIHRPVMLPAVRYLARMARAAGPAARLLRGVPGDDRRLRSGGGWRGFTEDEDVRTAVGALLTATGEGGEGGTPG